MNAPENQRAEEVLRAALRYFGLTRRLLISSARHEPIAYQRQIVMYALRECGEGLSFPMIGRMVGRDHTTVIHDCAKIADAIDGKVKNATLTDRAIRDVAEIRQRVQPDGMGEQAAVPVGKVDPLLKAVHEELRTLVPRLQHLYELLGDKVDAVENPGTEPKKRGLLIGDAKGGVAK